MSKKASEILIQAAELFEERNAVYGDNYLNAGAALSALFPKGLFLAGEDDFTRFHILMLQIVKLSRYCVNFTNGGHEDSIKDAAVYAAMLESIDSNIEEKKGELRLSRMEAAIHTATGTPLSSSPKANRGNPSGDQRELFPEIHYPNVCLGYPKATAC